MDLWLAELLIDIEREERLRAAERRHALMHLTRKRHLVGTVRRRLGRLLIGLGTWVEVAGEVGSSAGRTSPAPVGEPALSPE